MRSLCRIVKKYPKYCTFLRKHGHRNWTHRVPTSATEQEGLDSSRYKQYSDLENKPYNCN